MQQSHHSAADLTGDRDFPDYLDQREFVALLKSHGHPAVIERDGAILTECWCSKGESGFMAQERFTQSTAYPGLYRASAVLAWLGY